MIHHRVFLFSESGALNWDSTWFIGWLTGWTWKSMSSTSLGFSQCPPARFQLPVLASQHPPGCWISTRSAGERPPVLQPSSTQRGKRPLPSFCSGPAMCWFQQHGRNTNYMVKPQVKPCLPDDWSLIRRCVFANWHQDFGTPRLAVIGSC